MKLLALTLLALGAAACSATTTNDGASSNDALVALDDNEVLGEIQYGATQTVAVTPAPKYRAFWFNGTRGDEVQISVTALDATDPIVWLTDDQFNNIAENNDAKATDTSSLIAGQFLSKTGKYFVVFREVYGAPTAKFAVSVRKLGALPADCDPDDEGTWDSACSTPLDYNPFDPASCTGTDLTADQAKSMFGSPNGLRLGNAAVYYQTRQCNGPSDCSPWVYAYAMDADLATVTATAAGYEFATASTRKTKVDVTIDPAAGAKACLDGPFAAGANQAIMSSTWSAFTDGSAGVCTTALAGLATKVTSSCARFELLTIQLGSGDASHYTEFNPVLYAQL